MVRSSGIARTWPLRGAGSAAMRASTSATRPDSVQGSSMSLYLTLLYSLSNRSVTFRYPGRGHAWTIAGLRWHELWTGLPRDRVAHPDRGRRSLDPPDAGEV